jgi:hypothetical protein
MKNNKSLKDISEYLKQIDYVSAKIKFLQKEIPDLKVKTDLGFISKNPRFAAKSVNQNYTGIDFHSKYRTLSVRPYQELEFTYGDKTETIKVFSDPGYSRLVYIKRNTGVKNSWILNFSKIKINFERNNFNESMLKDCYLQIVQFIKKFPKYEMNTKHLDPKLKNLLAFS